MERPADPVNDPAARMARVREDLARVEAEFSKRIVGNLDVLRFMLKGLLSGGHLLLEGLPGLGKTLMVKTVADLLDLQFSRVQFTPDLMPADIVGTNMIVEDDRGHRQFRFEKGPVFTNILLADEINRASPKTQSALLQAMEEREATVFGERHVLDPVFLVMATQNPIEMAGTYPLPEAQLDRFMFKLRVPFPDRETLREIARVNMEAVEQGPPPRVLTREGVLGMRQFVREVPLTDRIYEFAAELVHLTHPGSQEAPPMVRKYVRYGASPRALNALLAAARVSAVLDGRFHVSADDLRENYLAAARHRIILGFEGEVEKVEPDAVLLEVFRAVAGRF